MILYETNLIAIFDNNFSNVLMCKRITPPFKYMYNLIGGKVEKMRMLQSVRIEK